MQVGFLVISKFSPGNRREFINSFNSSTQLEGGLTNCSFCRLFEDVGELDCFLWVEHWHNENTMGKYLQSNRFKTIMGAIETLGELISFDKIQFENIQQ
jgi:quinol monooxygenase YgiN